MAPTTPTRPGAGMPPSRDKKRPTASSTRSTPNVPEAPNSGEDALLRLSATQQQLQDMTELLHQKVSDNNHLENQLLQAWGAVEQLRESGKEAHTTVKNLTGQNKELEERVQEAEAELAALTKKLLVEKNKNRKLTRLLQDKLNGTNTPALGDQQRGMSKEDEQKLLQMLKDI